MPSSNWGRCSIPVTGRSAQLMSTAIRSPGNPSSPEAASCLVSHAIAASALNTCPASRRPSHPSAVICPVAIAGSTAIPRRDSSATAGPGPASLSHITLRPASSPSRTNAAVRSNNSSASPNVRHAWSSTVSSVICALASAAILVPPPARPEPAQHPTVPAPAPPSAPIGPSRHFTGVAHCHAAASRARRLTRLPDGPPAMRHSRDHYQAAPQIRRIDGQVQVAVPAGLPAGQRGHSPSAPPTQDRTPASSSASRTPMTSASSTQPTLTGPASAARRAWPADGPRRGRVWLLVLIPFCRKADLHSVTNWYLLLFGALGSHVAVTG